ncbi:hypothetical protein F7725_011109, partial [Dissostichus mawsoni]
MEVVAVSPALAKGGYFWTYKSVRAYCNSCTFFSQQGRGDISLSISLTASSAVFLPFVILSSSPLPSLGFISSLQSPVSLSLSLRLWLPLSLPLPVVFNCHAYSSMLCSSSFSSLPFLFLLHVLLLLFFKLDDGHLSPPSGLPNDRRTPSHLPFKTPPPPRHVPCQSAFFFLHCCFCWFK